MTDTVYETSQNIVSMRRDLEKQREFYSALIGDLEQLTDNHVRLHAHDASALFDDLSGVVDDISQLVAQIKLITGPGANVVRGTRRGLK